MNVFTILLLFATAQPQSAASGSGISSDFHRTALTQRLKSRLVLPFMTRQHVEWVMGTPFAADTHGPHGEAHTTYTYFESQVHITFGPDDRVIGISR